MLRRMFVRLITLCLALLVVVLSLRMIFPLPSTTDRPPDSASSFAGQSRLARSLAASVASHPGKSGVIELASGNDALSSRLYLINHADETIDAQYYIWQDDTSGRMLLKAILEAARRGVKVRLLLDDNGIPGLDQILASLDAEENIAIRLFNPSTVRWPKLAGYAFDFFRMNRRMHNKALVVDGAATIIGGRNIGDVYFEVGNSDSYIDLDALAVGETVGDVATEFQVYWNAASSIEAGRVLTAAPGDASALLSAPTETVSTEAERRAMAHYEQFLVRAQAAPEQFEWTEIRVVYDDPAKGLGSAADDQLLVSRFRDVAGHARSHAELASAYFVPGTQGVEYFAELVRSGIRVRILTNSARATDVLLVHTGYIKYRVALLEAGVELFELKQLGPARERSFDIDLQDVAGSSSASLHAKTFSSDGQQIFIGSFNFDPRSVMLNCEMGMIINSPRLASRMAATFDRDLALGAYQPRLRDGSVVWIETQRDGQEIVHVTEPGTTGLQRGFLWLVGYLPIEWLL